jgi:hypothetical protein
MACSLYSRGPDVVDAIKDEVMFVHKMQTFD